jgi:hypothetical protein
LGVKTINGAGGSEDQVLHPVFSAILQDIQESHNIAVHIRIGIGQGIADSRLGRQVDHKEGLLPVEHPRQSLTILQLHAEKVKIPLREDLVQARLFKGRIVVLVQAVQTEDFLPLGKQFLAKMKADKTRRAGNKDFFH